MDGRHSIKENKSSKTQGENENRRYDFIMWRDEDKNTGRNKHTYWTLLKNDEYLRKMCKAFVGYHKLSMRKISREIGVYPYQLSNYLNNRGKTKLSDLQIMRLADFLKLKITLSVELKENIEK